MKFMLSFTITPDKAKRDEAIQRFLKTGGQPPQGATLLGPLDGGGLQPRI